VTGGGKRGKRNRSPFNAQFVYKLRADSTDNRAGTQVIPTSGKMVQAFSSCLIRVISFANGKVGIVYLLYQKRKNRRPARNKNPICL
jgi:hypothetical protein